MLVTATTSRFPLDDDRWQDDVWQLYRELDRTYATERIDDEAMCVQLPRDKPQTHLREVVDAWARYDRGRRASIELR